MIRNIHKEVVDKIEGHWVKLDFGLSYAIVDLVNKAVPRGRHWDSKTESWFIPDEYALAFSAVLPRRDAEEYLDCIL